MMYKQASPDPNHLVPDNEPLAPNSVNILVHRGDGRIDFLPHVAYQEVVPCINALAGKVYMIMITAAQGDDDIRVIDFVQAPDGK